MSTQVYDSALRVSLGEAMSHRLLDATEEERLILAAQAGKRDERDALILHNLRLVASIAMRYPPAMQLDLFQEGVIGLLAAIERFDTSRGVRLSTPAVWWIRAYVSRAVRRMHATGSPCCSLDAGAEDDRARPWLERTYDRTAELPDEAVLDRHRSDEIRRMLALLLPKDREALEHWLGEDGSSLRTWVEVGELMGISRETARKYVNRALGALRADAGVAV